MEEKRKIKISLKTVIILVIILLIVIAGIVYMILTNNAKQSNKVNNNRSTYVEDDGCSKSKTNDSANLIKMYDAKPIIYLYPTEETEVFVKLVNSDKITCSYPQYTTGWNVVAKPKGDLIDFDTKKNLYALYYESESVIDFKVEKEGFVVKGEDSAKFLEEKLEILGLTPREAEEFIVYWLPKLEANNYNYIRFATMEEMNQNMPLEIKPNPDTLIRVLMTFKGLENTIEVEEQQLEKVSRTGFVAVEWGGTEIK